jgi:4-hydroxybenzoyl-CoA thioesterase/acyl-CoA thioester hydrolase
MAIVFRTSRRVEFRDTDAAGIAHFSVYFLYMEEAEHAFLRHLGLSVVTVHEGSEITWPRAAVSCEYRASLRFEDVATIEMDLERRGEKSVTYRFRFYKEDALVAEGTSTSVCCRVVANQKLEPMAIPPVFSEKLAAAKDMA